MFDYITCLGDPSDVAIASGTPYFFFNHGVKDSLIRDYICLSDKSYSPAIRRLTWNLVAAFRGTAGGYQYSDFFLESVWGTIHLKPNSSVINCFQMYPTSVNTRADLKRYYYIDMTLMQLFDFYGSGVISKRRKKQIISQEMLGYQKSDHVYCHSEWCKNSLVRDYCIPQEKITAIVPGANFEALRPRMEHSFKAGDSFKIVTIGREFYRKGIDRLIDSIFLLNDEGYDITLTVIGIKKSDIPERYNCLIWITWIESIDKTTSEDTFVDCVASHHLGALLSRAEAGGMAMREYHYCGIPSLHTKVGGAPEHSVHPATVGVDLDCNPRQIASKISTFIDDSAFYRYMKEHAKNSSYQATWASTIREFKNN